jgi:hypothetical protein
MEFNDTTGIQEDVVASYDDDPYCDGKYCPNCEDVLESISLSENIYYCAVCDKYYIWNNKKSKLEMTRWSGNPENTI